MGGINEPAHISGCTNDDCKLPLRFRSYDQWHGEEGFETYDSSEITDKWIYFFRPKPGVITSLYAEIYVNDQGEYEEVNWAQKEELGLAGKDERPTGSASPEFRLTLDTRAQGDLSFYVFLSDIQLSLRRIRAYRTDPLSLILRSQEFDPWDPDDPHIDTETDGRHSIYHVADHMLIAKNLQRRYTRKLNAYLNYVNDQDRRAKTFLANLTASVVEQLEEQDVDVWKWMQRTTWYEGIEDAVADRPGQGLPEEQVETMERTDYAFQRHLDTVNERQNEKYAACNDAVERKCAFLDLPAYMQVRADHLESGRGEKAQRLAMHWMEHEAFTVARTYECRKGQEALERWVSNDSNWLSRYFVGERFGIMRKSVRAYDAISDLFENWTVTKVKISTVETFVTEYVAILKKKLLVEPRLKVLPSGEMKWVTADEWETKYVPRRSRKLVSVIDVERVQVADLPEVPGKFMAALEVVNLVMVSAKVAEYRTEDGVAKASVELSAALGSVIDEVGQFALHKLRSKLTEELYERLSRRIMVAGIVGSVLDYVGAVWNAHEAVEAGDAGMAVGYAISAAGSVFLAAGGALKLGGATAFGMGAVGWTGIGAVLVLAGIVVVTLFIETDSPIQEWLETCEWGKKHTDKSIDRQLDELLHLIGRPKIWLFKDNEDLPQRRIKLVLVPGFFVEGETSYRVRLDVRASSGRRSYSRSTRFTLSSDDTDTLPFLGDYLGRDLEWHALMGAAADELDPHVGTTITYECTVRAKFVQFQDGYMKEPFKKDGELYSTTAPPDLPDFGYL